MAIKIIGFTNDISKTQYKKFSGTTYSNEPKPLSTILIGQLGKNSNVKENPVTGDILLRAAFKLINLAIQILPERLVLVECKPYKKLLEFYKNNGFKEIRFLTNIDNNLIRLVKFL